MPLSYCLITCIVGLFENKNSFSIEYANIKNVINHNNILLYVKVGGNGLNNVTVVNLFIIINQKVGYAHINQTSSLDTSSSRGCLCCVLP